MVPLLLSALAFAGTLRATVEIGADGPVLHDAVLLSASARSPSTLEGSDTARLEVLDVDGNALLSTSVPDARHRSVIFPEGGGAAVTLDRAVFRVDVPWPDGAVRLRLGDRELSPRLDTHRASPPPGLVPIQETGPADERLDLVFLGDGYTDGQLGAFADDVSWIVDYVLTVEPYSDYTGMFNIWRIDQASSASGVSHPGNNRNTAYGCYYGCAGIDRLICCDDSTVMSTVQQHLPGADGVLVLINDPVYGGSGGFNYATAYVGRSDGHQVAAHELGHSLIGLWDEYGYGYDAAGSGPNCSASEHGHWEDWTGTQGVGAFQECSYDRLYRPTESACMMRTLRDEYCPVCRQEAVLAMYAHLPRLIVSVDPPPGAELDATEEDVVITPVTVGPDVGLVYEWTVDGEVVSTDEALDLRCSGVNGEVLLQVYDDTRWVRADPDGLLVDQAGPWTVTSERCLRPDKVLDCEDGCSTTGGVPVVGWLVPLLVLIRRSARPATVPGCAARARPARHGPPG